MDTALTLLEKRASLLKAGLTRQLEQNLYLSAHEYEICLRECQYLLSKLREAHHLGREPFLSGSPQ